MPLKPLDSYPAGGVDSRSNPIVMPVDRYLMVHDLWPREDGSFQLRDGYVLLANGLQPGVPIHSIYGVTGPAPTYLPLIVFWQGTKPFTLDPASGNVTSPSVRGVAVQSSNRFTYFYTNGHLHAFNGTDAKWFDGFAWRDIGLPLPPSVAIAALQIIQSVREFSASELAAVTLTLAGGGTFPADVTGRTFYCPYYDLDLQEIGPATQPAGPNAGVVKFALNQELQVGGLPDISATKSRWRKLPALTGDGDIRARFAVVSTKQISNGTAVAQSFALTRSSASDNPSQFGAPSFAVALSAVDLSGGPATATVSGAEQTATNPGLAAQLQVTISGAEGKVTKPYPKPISPPVTLYDSGIVQLTLTAPGFSQSYIVNYSNGSTAAIIASALASRINALSGTRFSAGALGAVVSITPLTAGQLIVYAASASSATDAQDEGFGGTSFPIALSATQFGQTTVYDTGKVTVSVNGTAASAVYGPNDTPSTVASNLAAAINVANLGVSASAAGTVVTISGGVSGQILLTVVGNGFNPDDVVGLSNTGDAAYDGKVLTVAASTTDTITLNVPGATHPVTHGTIQKLLTVSAAGATAVIQTPAFFTPYQVNALRGIAATAIGGVQPGYEFYASVYLKAAGGHVGNRVLIGGRIAPAVRTNIRIEGPVALPDSEQLLLIGRTSDGAEVPYACQDLNANWVTWDGTGPSFLIDDASIDGNSELPSRNFPPPGTLDYNAQIAALNTSQNLPQQGAVLATFKRAWVESDHCCGAIDGSPTVYRSGSALDMREGAFVGLPEQSWDPSDIETFPSGRPITGGKGFNQESWVYTKQECAALMELAGSTQWQGPWNIGLAGEFAWAQGWQNMPYWITGKKQLATLSNGGYFSMNGMTASAAAGPIIISEEYESALLARIGDQYLSDTEISYIRHPEKHIECLRIKCRDANGFSFTVIHDFRLRDERSPYGQAYEERLGGPLAGRFTPGTQATRAGGMVSAALPKLPSDAAAGQFISLDGWSDQSFDGQFQIVTVDHAAKVATWNQAGLDDSTADGGTFALGDGVSGTPNFTQTVVRDANDEEQVVCGGPDGNLYLLYSGSDDSGVPFTAEALALRYLGSDRIAIKQLEWYGDQQVKLFVQRRLNTPFDRSKLNELTDKGAESVQGEDGDNHWRVSVDTPEMVHAYLLLQLTSHAEDGNTDIGATPHMPVENYGRVWMVTPLAGASRPK